MAEPELKHLPDVNAGHVLLSLNKERPKRAKKQVTRRPVPTPTSPDEPTAESEGVEDFFKPATVSQTPVLVTTPTPKPRPGTKTEKPVAKPEKPDDR